MYLQATATAVWAPRGQTPVVRLHPGREKVNFYGTPMESGNLRTGQEVVMRSDVMNAAATAQHLEQILQAVPEAPPFCSCGIVALGILVHPSGRYWRLIHDWR